MATEGRTLVASEMEASEGLARLKEGVLSPPTGFLASWLSLPFRRPPDGPEPRLRRSRPRRRESKGTRGAASAPAARLHRNSGASTIPERLSGRQCETAPAPMRSFPKKKSGQTDDAAPLGRAIAAE
jgi:hypothetical protein